MEFKQNDIHKFNKLFNEHKEKFILFANSYVRDTMASEDIYMESMLVFWQKMPELSDDTNIPAYILTIIKNKSLNYLRHKAIEQTVQLTISDLNKREIAMNIASLEACEPEKIFSKDIQQILDRTLNEMPENTKSIFNLSRFSNLTNKEIASQFNISEKGVEYHLTKALKSLRLALKDYFPTLLILSTSLL
jgi:RNA polymerase sigma-70 factor (ECF subfamily)